MAGRNDPTIFAKDDSGGWLCPDDRPYFIFQNDAKSYLNYGDMRRFCLDVRRIIAQAFLREQHRRRQEKLPPLPSPGEHVDGG